MKTVVMISSDPNEKEYKDTIVMLLSQLGFSITKQTEIGGYEMVELVKEVRNDD